MAHQESIITPMNTPAYGRLQSLRESQHSIMTEDGFTDVIALSDRLGIEVYQANMPDSESGYIEYNKETKDTYIVINQNHPITRQRFTVAHELGHYVNDYENLTEVGRLDRSRSTNKYGTEAEADQLAANILMPEDKTRESIDKFNPNDSWSYKIENIADQFKVSRPMAIIRLRELGIKVPYIEFA